MLAHLDVPKLPNGGTIHLFNHAVKDRFYMMGVILSAGLSFGWFRDQLGQMEKALAGGMGTDPYTLLTKAAAQSSPGSKGLIFLPYLTGERTPHGDGNARGGFFGLSASHERRDMVRAILEGVGFAFRDSFCLLQQAGWTGDSVRCIGGGAKSDLWLEILASILGSQMQT